MKLVDILARELDRWPQGMSETVGQGHKGYLHGYAGNGHPNCQTTKQIFTMCDDYGHEKVTRAEWQSAVDAMKADECAHSEANRLGCPECGADFRKPQYKAPAWNGEGLPPVGLTVETVCSGVVRVVEILCITERSVFLREPTRNIEWLWDRQNPGSRTFRPIKTPEQIAAEEREASVKEMQKVVNSAEFAHMSGLYALYDAGYRKFEIVEGKE